MKKEEDKRDDDLKKRKPRQSPTTEIVNPKETFINNPTSKPGIERSKPEPEYEVTDIPTEDSISRLAQETNSRTSSQIDSSSSSIGRGGIKLQ